MATVNVYIIWYSGVNYTTSNNLDPVIVQCTGFSLKYHTVNSKMAHFSKQTSWDRQFIETGLTISQTKRATRIAYKVQWISGKRLKSHSTLYALYSMTAINTDSSSIWNVFFFFFYCRCNIAFKRSSTVGPFSVRIYRHAHKNSYKFPSVVSAS